MRYRSFVQAELVKGSDSFLTNQEIRGQREAVHLLP